MRVWLSLAIFSEWFVGVSCFGRARWRQFCLRLIIMCLLWWPTSCGDWSAKFYRSMMRCLNQNRNTKQQWMIVSDVFCPYIWLDHGTNYNSELTHINWRIIAQTQTSAIGHARRPPTVFSGNCVPTVFAKPIAFVPVSPVFAHGARLSSICQHLEYELTTDH